jgi:hypothetical protein
MLTAWSSLSRCAVIGALALGTIGCTGSSKYMREVVGAPPIAAPADKAAVVFVRPSGMAFAMKFAILDQQGKWLGDAVAKSQFGVLLPPGEYMFVAWAENTAALKATVAPGKRYFVRVDPAMGLGSARVSLEALTKRHPDWKEVDGWMRELQRLEPLPDGAANIAERGEDAAKRVRSAQENWVSYSAAEKEERTLRAEDGI